MEAIEYKIEVNNPKIDVNNCYGIIEGNLACVWLNVHPRAYVAWSSTTLDDCPLIGVYFTGSVGDMYQSTPDLEISFPGLKGYSVHCGGSGKSIPISFVKKEDYEKI